ncbi:MAG: hypothetical protein AABY22_21905, partial [Nanoarchaeota archaeon]
FIDMDCIPLKDNFLQITIDKIKDKRTLFGICHQANHLPYKHPFIGAPYIAFSRELYCNLGMPNLSDTNPRSDMCEELTYVAQEKGYQVCFIYPSDYHPLIEAEMSESGNPKYWNLGHGLKYGLGTTFGDIFFHAYMQGLPRSSEVFIKRCKEILGETLDNKENKLEAIVTCVNYGDILELTLPENKKHFDNLVIITDTKDVKTKEICDKEGVSCIQTDVFYENGAIFNKSAAMNLAYKNLKYHDWCINLDADIILSDNFRYSFFSYNLDKNLLYGASRKFIWNYEQYLKWKKKEDIDEELLTLESPGVGYFQAFNFDADCLKGISFDKFIPDSFTAEKVDALFFYRWYPQISPEIPKLHFEVIHLGPPGLF